MTINERIKQLRISLDLTQSDFGEKIGLKKSALSRIEKDVPVNPRVAQLICTNFHVNEAWLLNGEGEMFANEEIQLLEQLAKNYNMNAAELTLVQHWLAQPESIRNAVVDYALSLSDKIAKQQRTAADYSHEPESNLGSSRPDGISDQEWLLLQEMRKEKETSAASPSTDGENLSS